MNREEPFPYLRRVHWRPRPPACTIVFLHIPKTGGKSLREVLLAGIGRHAYFSVAHPIDDARRLEVLHRDDRAALALVEGHLYYGIHELLPRLCVYLTVLRDPVERVLSLYSYIRASAGHHLHERVKSLSVGECLRAGLSVELDNFMVRCLSGPGSIRVPIGGVSREMLIQAGAHLESCAGIGLTERFDESVRRFRRLLGWKGSDVPRVNRTNGRVERSAVSEGDLDLIRRHNVLDQELYARAVALFEARGSVGSAGA